VTISCALLRAGCLLADISTPWTVTAQEELRGAIARIPAVIAPLPQQSARAVLQ
jgi:hypothetical protein